MFRPMAQAVLLALGGSYLVTLLLIPVFSLSLLKIPNKEKKHNATVERINKFYVPILLFGFRNRAKSNMYFPEQGQRKSQMTQWEFICQIRL